MRWPVICFDLDGTLCDTREGIFASLQHTIDAHALPHPGGDLQRFIGPPLHEIYGEGFGLPAHEVQAAVDAYREFYVAGAMFLNSPYPGIPALLRELREAGARLTVCTAKPWRYAKQILEAHEICELFEFVSGPELDGSRRHKPEIIGYALDQLDLPADARTHEKVVMIGDRHYDIDGAHALGLASIAAHWGFGNAAELNKVGAQHHCQAVADLRTLLLA